MVLCLRGGGKRGRGSSAGPSKDVKDLEELNMLIACQPKINEDDSPQVRATLSLVLGSVLAWLETVDIPTLEIMEQDNMLERPRTGNLDHHYFLCGSLHRDEEY